MGIVTREFTYKGRIKVSREDFRLAQKGRKTCTIRLGKLDVANRTTSLTDGTRTIPIQVTEVDDSRVYRELTEEDARKDGVPSLAALDADLRQYYGPIDPEQPITLIHFALTIEQLGFLGPLADTKPTGIET